MGNVQSYPFLESTLFYNFTFENYKYKFFSVPVPIVRSCHIAFDKTDSVLTEL